MANDRARRPAARPQAAAQRVTPQLQAAVRAHRAGQLDVAERAYREILAHTPRQPDALHLLALIHHARDDHATALNLIDGAVAAAPRTAAFHVARAAILQALRQRDVADAAARRALALDPARPDAHNTLGLIQAAAGDSTAAADSFRAAIARRADYAEAHNNLGSVLRTQGRLTEAETALRAAIGVRPGYASAWANLGLVLQERGRYDEALPAYDRALAADPGHAAAHGNRGMLLLLLGRLTEGFSEYEWRWRMPGFATAPRTFAKPAWNGGDLGGRTVFVHAEQGLGSAIQFVRFAREAAETRGGRVILECQPPLVKLFRQSLVPDPLAAVVEKGTALPEFDCHAPLMSLPHLLGTTTGMTPASIPYLRADPADVAAWQQRLEPLSGGYLRVGLVWAGNRLHENDANRSMPASALAPVVATAGRRFFSLQVPVAPADLAALGAVTDLAPWLSDFAQTAAAIACLDLVISVDTAAAHLAGALGRPVWLLLPAIPEWRWQLDREDSPWYPSLRIFRQQQPGDWAELIDRVAAALAAWSLERTTTP